jgi:glutamate-ammonia-ligase adenylyltransferase
MRTARLRALAESVDEAAASEIRAEVGAVRAEDDLALAIAQAIAAVYPAMRALVVRRFDACLAIGREGFRARRKRAEFVKRLLSACKRSDDAAFDLATVRRGLRRASDAERLRIALRELDPEIGIDVTAKEWSELAEAQLEVALLEARAHVERRFGAIVDGAGARNGFVVIGLGKLGGAELNAGSDVDLQFLHAADEGTAGDGGDALRPFDAFTRIAQRLVATVEEHDDDGFCARVDLRLRPEGSGGPLVNSIASAAAYYESFGRSWERAAMLRARPVAGDLEVGTHALAELAPFVYRRVVDPSIALEMIEMVRRGRTELSAAPERDLKLGIGGIREAEFFVQTLQLVWGGKDPSVRSTNTLEGLRRLRARGYVTDREARALGDGYLLLRRIEHRVQLGSGVQTHLLPTSGDERERLARSLGYRNDAAMTIAIERTRARIAERFASLAPSAGPQGDDPRVSAIFRALDLGQSPDLPEDARASAASPGPEDLYAVFRALGRRPDAPLGGRTRERHPRFSRALVSAILDAADPDLAANTVRSFFERLSAPGVAAYVRALEADERALSRFVGLCGTSAPLGRSLVGHPELADALLFAARSQSDDDLAVDAAFAEEIARVPEAEREDPESFVGALRRAKAHLELAVGLRDLAGEIGARQAGRALASIAEATIDAVARFALDEAARRRKLPSVEGFAVLALGSLGARDLGYGSDLDVVFVYDPSAVAPHGLDELDASEIYGRIAQRIVRLVSTTHPDGPGYDLDTRLRPSGEQGHLCVSLEGFRAYHDREEGDRPGPRAADWERQALVRLRACGGDPRVGRAAEQIARAAAYERPPPRRDELRRLRARMEAEIAKERDGRFDPKVGRGGLADVELAVQWLQMTHGRDEAVRTTEVHAAIDALEARGHLPSHVATVFRDGHRFLRRLEQRARVIHGGRGVLLEASAPGLSRLARALGFRDGPSAGASELLMRAYAETTNEVRAAFLEVLAERGDE